MDPSFASDFDQEWDAIVNGIEIPSHETFEAERIVDNDHQGQEKISGRTTKVNGSFDYDSENQSDDDSESESESEVNDQNELLETVSSTFNTLILQVDELREKYKKESEQRKKIEIANKKMALELASLEEENNELQEALQTKHDRRRGSVALSSSSRRNNRVKLQPEKNPDQNIRLALIQGDDEDFSLGLNEDIKTKSTITGRIARTIYGLLPFEKDVRVIQASFGGAVAAYYNFFRWMIYNWVIVALICTVFGIAHVLSMIFRQGSSGLLVGSGILPRFMEYSSFTQNEKFLYTANVVIVIITLVVICVRKVISEDKMMKRMDIIENENDFTFSKDVFGGWDHSLTQSTEVVDLHGLMNQVFREKLAELKLAGLRKTRSNMKILELYARRFAAFVIYFAVQIASYSSIVYLTVKSQSIQNGLSIGALKSLSAFIVPAAVTAINSVTPALYKVLTKMELWDSGQVQLNILLFRMYISNMMNLLILAISYALLADPFLFADNSDKNMRKQIEHEYSADFTCRMDQAANGMFTLIITEFFLNGLVFYGMGLGNIFVNNFIMPFPKKEFNIAQRMVAMLYFVSLMLLTFPFTPLSVIVLPVMLACRIKWEKYVTLKCYAKPKTVWTAHKAGTFFVLFYIMSLSFVAVPSAVYFLSRETFPKSCDIQDVYPELCESDISDDGTCTLNVDSDYYSLYNDNTYCQEGYPACICDYACGAFVHEHNAFAPFRRSIQDVAVVEYLWEYILKTSYGAWFLTGFFYVLSRMRRNTVSVNSQGFKDKERSLETHITALENEKKKHEKLINRLKLIEGPSIGIDSASSKVEGKKTV